MGDFQADDGTAGPPTKKRVASRQISKDDNSDVEDERGEQEGATFQRAPEQVLATRKILKVRRSAANVTPSLPNPFAAIRLVPPTSTTGQEGGVTPSTAMEEANSPSIATSLPTKEAAPSSPHSESVETVATDRKVVESPTNELGKAVSGGGDLLGEGFTEKEGQDGENGDEDTIKQQTAHDKNVELEKGKNKEVHAKIQEDRVEEPKSAEEDKPNNDAGGNDTEQEINYKQTQGGFDGKSSLAFGELLSAKKAFAGFGTGLSTSSFSFGTTQASVGTSGFAPFSSVSGFGSGSAFAVKGAGEGGFSSFSNVFGKSNGASPFQLFGSQANTGSSACQQSLGCVSLQEVLLETGEEQEKVVFSADATLFEFIEGGWKERGKGELKVNVPEDNGGRPRLVMRSKGNYRLLLNASLFPDMKMTSMDSRGVTFACVNSAAEEKEGLTTYAVRLKDGLSATSFREAVDTNKGKPSVNLKTPENSPRAPHDSARGVEASKP